MKAKQVGTLAKAAGAKAKGSSVNTTSPFLKALFENRERPER